MLEAGGNDRFISWALVSFEESLLLTTLCIREAHLKMCMLALAVDFFM